MQEELLKKLRYETLSKLFKDERPVRVVLSPIRKPFSGTENLSFYETRTSTCSAGARRL